MFNLAETARLSGTTRRQIENAEKLGILTANRKYDYMPRFSWQQVVFLTIYEELKKFITPVRIRKFFDNLDKTNPELMQRLRESPEKFGVIFVFQNNLKFIEFNEFDNRRFEKIVSELKEIDSDMVFSQDCLLALSIEKPIGRIVIPNLIAEIRQRGSKAVKNFNERVQAA